MIKVLFVCTGNICRSPTADGLFRHLINQRGLHQQISCDSAGTHGYHVGDPPDSRTIHCAAARGVDLSDLRARQFIARDLQTFDVVLAMDRGHLAAIRRIAEDKGLPHHHVRLMLDYAPHVGEQDVPDPYYGSARDFTHVFDLLEVACEGLLREIQSELPARAQTKR